MARYSSSVTKVLGLEDITRAPSLQVVHAWDCRLVGEGGARCRRRHRRGQIGQDVVYCDTRATNGELAAADGRSMWLPSRYFILAGYGSRQRGSRGGTAVQPNDTASAASAHGLHLAAVGCMPMLGSSMLTRCPAVAVNGEREGRCTPITPRRIDPLSEFVNYTVNRITRPPNLYACLKVAVLEHE